MGFSSKELRQDESSDRIRQVPTLHGGSRTQSATENASGLLPADPQLATIIDAWPKPPDAIRAGILAMLEAALPT
jgi:hypothetical protein